MSTPWIIAFACLWVVVIVLGFSVVGVMRRIGGVLERAEHLLEQRFEGVPPLTVIPPFQLIDERNQPVGSEDLLQETTILLFMEAHCGPCRALAADLGDSGAIKGLPLVVVAGEDGLGADIRLPDEVPVYRQHNRDVARLFKSAATPQAFVVDSAGVVLDGLIPGSIADLERMAERQEAGRRLEGSLAS